MSIELSLRFFDILKNRIGEVIYCKRWVYGKEITTSGILKEVIDFTEIILDNGIIPFVGPGTVIEEIYMVTKTGEKKLLYVQPNAKYCNVRDDMGVVNAQRELLGYSVKMDELESNTTRRR